MKLVRIKGRHAACILGLVVVAAVAVALWKGAHGLHARRRAGNVDSYRDLIWRYARDNSLPTELVRSVIIAESGGDPTAVSTKNARGLMQIMPAAETDVLRKHGWPEGDLFDPEYNIRIGTAYLRMLADRFDDDYELVVAAYHMGQGTVSKLRKAHPNMSSRKLIETYANPTTRAYCRKVLRPD